MIVLQTLLLGAILLLLVGLVAILLVFARYVAQTRASVEEFIIRTFTRDEKGESDFSRLVDATAAIISARLITSASAAVRGSAGGTAKGENAAANAGNPIAALLGGKLGKSPLAAAALGLLGQNLFGPKQPGTIESGANGAKPKFKLGV